MNLPLFSPGFHSHAMGVHCRENFQVNKCAGTHCIKVKYPGDALCCDYEDLCIASSTWLRLAIIRGSTILSGIGAVL